MKKKYCIFGSGTMRSGGSLHCNLLSTHKDVIILHDNLHFFRHIYNKYKPIKKISNLYKLSGELNIRLKYRTDLLIDKNKFFLLLLIKKPKNYSEVYSTLMQTFLNEAPNKKIIGEYANGEFRKIETFLKFNKNNIAFQVFRDPRAMLMSWKRITFAKGYKYLNAIFNWLDAADTAIKNKKKFGNKRFLILKFEETHTKPKKVSKKLCKFLKIKFDKNMVNTKNWKKLLKSKYNFINTSSYTKKHVYGFSKKRISNWKNNIDEWEHNLIDYLCASRMKKMGYKVNFTKYPTKGINIMKSDSLLSKRLKKFLKTNQGTDAKLNDPANPKNWEAAQTSGLKFVDSPEYALYMKEIRQINRESKIFNKIK